MDWKVVICCDDHSKTDRFPEWPPKTPPAEAQKCRYRGSKAGTFERLSAAGANKRSQNVVISHNLPCHQKWREKSPMGHRWMETHRWKCHCHVWLSEDARGYILLGWAIQLYSVSSLDSSWETLKNKESREKIWWTTAQLRIIQLTLRPDYWKYSGPYMITTSAKACQGREVMDGWMDGWMGGWMGGWANISPDHWKAILPYPLNYPAFSVHLRNFHIHTLLTHTGLLDKEMESACDATGTSKLHWLLARFSSEVRELCQSIMIWEQEHN